MSWLGGSISSLTGQLSNLTKDILTEGTEEISDPSTELSLAKEKIQQLDAICTHQRQENERLKVLTRELEEKAESSELQINNISGQYRGVLEEKEREVHTLRQQHQELLEASAHSAHLDPSPGVKAGGGGGGWDSWDHGGAADEFASSEFSNGDDYDSSIRLQRENNTIRGEVQRLQAQVTHWRSVAGQLGQNAGGQDAAQVTSSADVLELQQKVKDLEQQLCQSRDDLQHQAASLHDLQREKLATLKVRHTAQLDTLQGTIHSLEHQLMEAREGSSSIHSGSGTLPESDRADDLEARLAQACQDRDKAQNAQQHMQGVMEELQQEVESLQRGGAAAMVEDLKRRLKESESALQASQAKLSHDLQQSLMTVKHDQQEAKEATHALIDHISEGGPDLLPVSLKGLEQENITLRAENLKLQEQVILLEKAAVSSAEDRQSGVNIMRGLQAKLRSLTGETEADTDNTLDAEFSSLSSDADPSSALHISSGAVDQELASLRAQLKEQEDELKSVKSQKSWGSVGSTGEMNKLEAELSSLRSEKMELEGAIDELDSQHTEAVGTLITQRDQLASELTESNKQLSQQKAEIVDLNAMLDSHKAEIVDLTAMVDSLSVELADQTSSMGAEETVAQEKCDELEKDIKNLKRQGGRDSAELFELRDKLQKGGMVINDLHMDKEELEEELKKTKEEMAVKVDKIKALKEDNDKLKEEKTALEKHQTQMTKRQGEMEEEIERWQKENEQTQIERMNDKKEHSEISVLKKEVEKMASEKDIFVSEIKKLSLSEKSTGIVSPVAGLEDQNLLSVLFDCAEVRNNLLKKEEIVIDLRRANETIKSDRHTLECKYEEQKTFYEKDINSMKEQLDILNKEKSDLITQIRSEESKLEAAGKQHEKLSSEKLSEISQMQQANSALEESLKSQKKHFDEYEQDLQSGRELEAESLQSEHEKLLSLQRDNNLEIDSLKTKLQERERVEAELQDSLKLNLQEKERLELELQEKTATVNMLRESISTFVHEMNSVKEEIDRLENACNDKDRQIEVLKLQVDQFGTNLDEIEDSVTIAEDNHFLEISGKEDQLKALKNRNMGLERSLSQTQEELQKSQSQVDLEKMGESSDSALDLAADSASSSDAASPEVARLKEIISQLQMEAHLSQDNITRSNLDLSSALQTVQCHEFGIANLNEKADERQRDLDRSESDLTRQKNDIAVLRQDSLDKESMFQEFSEKLGFLVTILTPEQMERLKQFTENPPSIIPASEYTDVKAIEYVHEDKGSGDNNNSTGQNGAIIEEIDDLDAKSPLVGKERRDSKCNFTSSPERLASVEREVEELRECLKEKDTIVSQLQKSNTGLLGLLDGKPLGGGGGGGQDLESRVETNKLEAELRNLSDERESMVAVVSEKSRENSSLKAEVHRLMEVVSAGQGAMIKLQEDLREIEQHQKEKAPSRPDEAEEDDMRREALTNMARLVRDRETEIEALHQKISTLMAVLQDSGNESAAAAHLAPLLQEKEDLAQQVSDLSSEREQLVTCLTQKHTEVVTYYTETQRLVGLVNSTQEDAGRIQTEYNSLVPAFEDKSRALVGCQAEMVELKGKLREMEVRHGEMLQRLSSQQMMEDHAREEAQTQGEGSPRVEAISTDELDRLRQSDSDLRGALTERESHLVSLQHRVSSLEEQVSSRDAEAGHLRKQTESSKFQLTGLMAELEDLKAERQGAQHKAQQQDSECTSLRDSVNQLTLAIRERDMELTTLKEHVTKLTHMLQEQRGEQGQVTQLMRENEAATTTARQLTQERDSQAMLATQRTQESQALKAELQNLKDKEFKLTRELDRLRGHLVQIEEGYTQEALDSEEREKDLRTRLAHVEEHSLSSSTQVQVASQEAQRQVESLHQQLTHTASQRDQAYMQLAQTQDQCAQYAQSLANLQLVLEHFQKEKDSAIAAETERYQDETRRLKTKVIEMTADQDALRGDLSEALDGLEAASRLSEQLDRKEEALRALKEEVHLREKALEEAEGEIRKLSSSTEAKVDKQLMHNMVMTWLTSPEGKRMEIVHLIGNVLSFSPDDFQKIQSAQKKGASGLLSSIWGRPAETPPADQSFSQMFVKFLEKESSPPPSPLRLPAEAMAAETAGRHKPPTFNPFTAPRHVTQDAGSSHFSFPPSSQGSHHLLMGPDAPTSPLFAPLTAVSSAGESAILKDVLGKR